MIVSTSFPSVSNMKSIAGNSEIPPVWLTGRLSLAGNSPKFNCSSASSSNQSFDELRALTGERTERPDRDPPAPRWFLISQNHHRTVRLETPASAVDQIVSYCWTFWESKIFKEYSQILQTIQNIHWFQSFSHQRGSCRASSVSSHQLWPRVRFLW